MSKIQRFASKDSCCANGCLPEPPATIVAGGAPTERPNMNVKDVKKILAEIRSDAKEGLDWTAHEKERAMFVAVLEAIERDDVDEDGPAAVAQAALASTKIKFERWFR